MKYRSSAIWPLWFDHESRHVVNAVFGIGLLSKLPEEHTDKKLPTSTWCREMETFSALLALCAGNSPVTGEFPSQRPVTRSFDVFFDLCLNNRLSKQWWGWWFETPSQTLWRHCNVRCLQQWQSWHHENYQYSVDVLPSNGWHVVASWACS